MVEIVAEISGNHGGSLVKACHLIVQAAAAGCDYAKFQYYRPEDMPDRHIGENEKMYQELAVPDYWLPEMFKTAKLHSIGLFASVFSARAAKEILKFDVPYIKIASPASTKLAVETYGEIVACVPPVVEIIWSGKGRATGVRKILYCPEGHPPTITWDDFYDFRTGNYWGLSDHTPGIGTPLAFIRAGAEMIEKHLKLDDNCEDAAFSADRKTMELLCKLAHNR